jgi:hypothetical protein
MASSAIGEGSPALGDGWLKYVLDHPLRMQIAAVLEERRMDVPELAEALGEPLPLVAYHYGVLVGSTPEKAAEDGASVKMPSD